MRLIRYKRGLSPVLSSIILSAVVLVIGASVWSVSSSASSILQINYYRDVMESVGKIKERFYIENIGFDDASEKLKVWIFNYGDIDVTVELIRVKGGGNVSTHLIGTAIPAGRIIEVNVVPATISLASGMSVSIEVKSTRGNKAYDSILLP